jgi:hypothetical protein
MSAAAGHKKPWVREFSVQKGPNHLIDLSRDPGNDADSRAGDEKGEGPGDGAADEHVDSQAVDDPNLLGNERTSDRLYDSGGLSVMLDGDHKKTFSTVEYWRDPRLPDRYTDFHLSSVILYVCNFCARVLVIRIIASKIISNNTL